MPADNLEACTVQPPVEEQVVPPLRRKKKIIKPTRKYQTIKRKLTELAEGATVYKGDSKVLPTLCHTLVYKEPSTNTL